jgi:hypothetical protein
MHFHFSTSSFGLALAIENFEKKPKFSKKYFASLPESEAINHEKINFAKFSIKNKEGHQ